MTNNPYFKNYVEQQRRLNEEIEREDNPYHKQHIREFSDMIDDRLNAVVPQMLEEQQARIQVDIETYLNGRRVTSNSDFVRGVRDMVINAIKGRGWGR